MQPHTIDRAAMLMREKYGDNALPKAVAAAKYYAEANDNDGANRWIKIGYAIKTMQDEEFANRKAKKVTKQQTT